MCLTMWLSGKESACQCRRCGFNPWVRKMPWRKKWQPTPVFLPRKPHGEKNLAGYSPWDHKESDTTYQLSTHLHNVFAFLSYWMSTLLKHWGFPGASDSKESTCNAGDLVLIPWLRRSPGERNGYPPQYSCLEDSMDRGAWWATIHGVARSWTRLS